MKTIMPGLAPVGWKTLITDQSGKKVHSEIQLFLSSYFTWQDVAKQRPHQKVQATTVGVLQICTS
jgi:hypothetical protein